MINTKQSIHEVCRLALTHRLFIPGWCMRDELVCASRVKAAALFYDGDKPVAVGLIGCSYDIQIFVRLSHRRKGIGSKLVTHLRDALGPRADRMDAGSGVTGSTEFWNKNGVKRWD